MKKLLHSLKTLIFAIVFIAMANLATSQTNQTICAGQSATLTASGGTSYSWSTGDTTASTIVTPTNTTQYFVTVTLSGNTTLDSVTVTVNQNPVAGIAGDNSIDAGTNDTLTASGGTSYSWSIGATAINAVQIVSPTIPTIYTVTVTNAGCISTSSITVTVNPPPIQHVFNICTGQSVQLTAPQGISYLWSTNDTTETVVVSPNITQSFYVTVTEAANTVVDSFLVNIKPNPVVYAGPDVISPSPGSAITLTATDSTDANVSFQWDNFAATTGATITVYPQISTSYGVTVKDISGCTATSKVTITVNNIYTEQTVYNICSGQSVMLKAPQGATYSWNTGDSTATIVVSPDSAKTYIVSVTQTSGNIIDSFIVYLKPSPIINVVSDTISPGPGFPITLTATGGTATTKYQWKNDPTGNNVTIVNPTITTTYTVFAFDNKTGCQAAANSTVTVNNINSSSIFIGTDSAGRSLISTLPDSALYIQSARYASPDSLRNTIINSNNAGRVGIGTNNPSEKLTVAGNISTNKIITSRITSPDSLIHFGDSSLVIDYNYKKIYNDGLGVGIYSGWKGVGIGTASQSPGVNAVGIGYNAQAWNKESIAIGANVRSYADYNVVIGSTTNGLSTELYNNIPYSLMVGFKSDVSTLFVGPGDGTSGSIGNVGIGTSTPVQKFEVVGTSYFNGNVGIGTTTPKDLLQVGDGLGKAVLGSLGGTNSNLGWSTSYIGFNAYRDATNSQWVFSDGFGNNGGGVIMNDLAGTMIFIPINSSSDVSSDQIIPENSNAFYNKRVMELMPRGGPSNEGMLAINGVVMAKEVIITTDPGTFVWWPDYVFDKKYNLMPINELEKYLKKNKHLPDVPSSNDIIKKGVNVEEMDATLLKKIEELTLYVIDLKKQNDEMQKSNDELNEKVKALENFMKK